MKIIDTYVDDPRFVGKFSDPILYITVDEPVEEMDATEHGPWRTVPCGPFVAVEHKKNNDWMDADEEEVGIVNTRGFHNKQLFPVRVIEPDGLYLQLSMSVERARRQLRKAGLGGWGITLSEPAGLRGRLQWRLESTRPMCYSGATPRSDNCLREPVTTIVHKRTHIPVCQTHLIDYQSKLMIMRTK